MIYKIALVASVALAAALAAASAEDVASVRQRKAFPIFNVVKFKQTACTIKSDESMRGVCLSESECSDESGTADGNCAAGFGVCCMFKVDECNEDVDKNSTYIQNEGYPTGVSGAANTCRWTFNRICDDLCQIRLDFDNLVLAAPATDGDCDTDRLSVDSPTGADPPRVCGTLSGQHMYLETGDSGTAGSLQITRGTSSTSRTWKIRVSYIECSNPSKADADCLQWFTGTSGSFQTYNHQGGTQLTGQMYNICMRKEQGYCSFKVTQSTSTTPDPFQLVPIADAPDVQTGTRCLANPNYITFPVAGAGAAGDLRCGELLGNVADDLAAGAVYSDVAATTFQVTYVSEFNLPTPVGTGFNLDYVLIPCN